MAARSRSRSLPDTEDHNGRVQAENLARLRVPGVLPRSQFRTPPCLTSLGVGGGGVTTLKQVQAVQSQPRGPWRKEDAVSRKQRCWLVWQPQGEQPWKGSGQLDSAAKAYGRMGGGCGPQGRIVYKHLRPF